MNDPIPQSNQSPLSTRFYASDCIHLIGRYWPVLFIVPALLVSGVLYLHLTSTKYYGASASVYMDPSFGSRISTESVKGESQVLRDDEAALFSMEETICSDAMILRVAKKLDLLDDPSFLPKSINKRIKKKKEVTEARIVHEIRKRYAAELINATRILKVYVEDTKPERSVLIAQTFIDEFVTFLQEQKVESEAGLKENLLKQAEVVKQRAITAEQQLNSFRSKHTGFLVEQDSNLFTTHMQESGKELNDTKAELLKLDTLLAGLEQIDARDNPVRILNLAKGEYAVDFDEVLAQRAAALIELQDIQQRFGPRHADYRSAYNRFKSIDQSIQRHAQEIKNSTRTRRILLDQQKNAQEHEMALLREKFNSYKSAGAEFRGLKGSVDREWAQYEKINDRILSLTDKADLSANVATPLGDPIVPFNSTKRHLIKLAAAAILLSAGWVVFAGAYLIFRGLPFTCHQQIQDILDVPVAGRLTRSDLSRSGVLSSLPLLTSSSKVVHLTSVDLIEGASVCQMVTESYLERGSEVTILQVSDRDGAALYEFKTPGVDIFQVFPSQIEVRKLRITIRDFISEHPNKTILIDSTGVTDLETKLALGKITNSTVVVIQEDGINREITQRWLERFKKESGNIIALYQTSNYPTRGVRKALPMKAAQSVAEPFQLN